MTHGRGFTLVELLIAIVVILILVLLLAGAWGRVSEIAYRVQCTSNLRSLHSLMQAYANDHENRLPASRDASLATWTTKVKPYLPKDSVDRKIGITYCPSTKRTGLGIYKRDAVTWRTDYSYNGNVITTSELNNTRSQMKGNWVLLFDGAGAGATTENKAYPSRRHLKCFNVLFVDGHVESLSSFEDTNLLGRN